jgi:anti-sigma-K factor RskA
MWLIPAKGAPVSEGLMDAAALSKEATIHGVNSAAVFAITVEPAGGSAQPTQAAIGAVTLHSA